MLLPFAKPASMLLAMLMTLTSCAPRPAGSSSSRGPEELTPPSVSQGNDSSDPLEELTPPSVSQGSGSQGDASLDEADVEALAPVLQLTQEDVDQALEEVMANYSAAAVSVAAIEHGQLSQSGAWGWAVKDEREMTPDTKVRIASISKVVVGMCAMAMAEDGLLDLDAPLSDYWGAGVGNPYSEGHPSARNLMTHTSSVKDLSTTRGLSKLRGLLQSSSSWRSMEPGDGGYWYYSNFGFCVLGTALELAADRLLDDYLQERFLQPMGIRATFYSGNMEEDEVATLYTTGGIGRSAAEHAGQTVPTEIGMGASYYPGGFTVSAVDMAKLVSVLINDGTYQGTQYLTPESVAAMETPQFTVDPGETSPFEQCLVLRRQENVLGQDVLYYHTGSAYGVFSLMTYNPETGNGVVVITTGTARKTDEHGLYALCADLSENLYARMEQSA